MRRTVLPSACSYRTDRAAATGETCLAPMDPVDLIFGKVAAKPGAIRAAVKFARFLVLWLVVVALPGYAYASLRLVAPHCPMQSSQPHVSSEADDLDAAEDCCADAQGQAVTGKLCKTGAQCHPAHALGLAPPLPEAGRGIAAQADTPAADLRRGRPSSSVWRPPRLV